MPYSLRGFLLTVSFILFYFVWRAGQIIKRRVDWKPGAEGVGGGEEEKKIHRWGYCRFSISTPFRGCLLWYPERNESSSSLKELSAIDTAMEELGIPRLGYQGRLHSRRDTRRTKQKDQVELAKCRCQRREIQTEEQHAQKHPSEREQGIPGNIGQIGWLWVKVDVSKWPEVSLGEMGER